MPRKRYNFQRNLKYWRYKLICCWCALKEIHSSFIRQWRAHVGSQRHTFLILSKILNLTSFFPSAVLFHCSRLSLGAKEIIMGLTLYACLSRDQYQRSIASKKFNNVRGNVYFYFGERVTLKTVSLQTDTRLKKKKSSESRSSISKRCWITLKNSLNSTTLYLKIKRLQLLEKRKRMLSEVDYTNPKPQQYRHLAWNTACY